jgi:glycosyltransferase involved in cell wall biosynthesis
MTGASQPLTYPETKQVSLGKTRVSVVLPTYNGARFIGEAINSVLQQTYKDLELIVVDDGSTDDTQAVVLSFSDPRIIYVRQDNQERSVARNTGINLARGELIAFLDDDDFWLPEYLDAQVGTLDARPDCGWSRTFVYDVDVNGRAYRIGGAGAPDARTEHELLSESLISNCVSNAAVVLRAECLREVGVFDTSLRQGEDWDLWLRMAMRYRLATIPRPLACYRHYNSFMPERELKRGLEHASVSIVEKAFSLLADSPFHDLSYLRPQALADAYFRASMNHYALHNLDAAQVLLTCSYQLYPEFFLSPYDRFVQATAYRADMLYDVMVPLDQALQFIDTVFKGLPDWAGGLRSQNRRARGFYYGLHFFRSYERRDRLAMLSAAPHAALSYPEWLRNRGFIALTLRTLVPGLLPLSTVQPDTGKPSATGDKHA